MAQLLRIDEFLALKPKGGLVIDVSNPKIAHYVPRKIANSIMEYGNSNFGKALLQQSKDHTLSDISGVELAKHFEGTLNPWLQNQLLEDMKKDDKKDAITARLRAKLAAKKSK